MRTTLALAYVDLNAVRAGMVAGMLPGMVKRAADYAWSSAAAQLGLVATGGW